MTQRMSYNRISIKQIATVTTLAIVLATSLAVGTASAANVTFNSKRNCDTNAILNCGAMSISELQSKYNSNPKARTVYDWYRIDRNAVNNMQNTTVAGAVTKSGDVVVGGKVVAKNAISAGYHNMKGSTPVTYQGVTFYNSSPSTSFLSNQIDAYVIMNDKGQYVAAILAACGNPVKANNVVPAPVPKQTPAPTPVPTPAPAPTPVVPAAAVAPVELPKAGAGSIAALFAGASSLAGIGHFLVMRRKQNV